MKILPVGPDLYHEDGRTDRQVDRHTDMTKLIVAVRDFANTLKIHHGPKFLGLRNGHFQGERVRKAALTESKSKYILEIWLYLEESFIPSHNQ
jgi:hypothetical protein